MSVLGIVSVIVGAVVLFMIWVGINEYLWHKSHPGQPKIIDEDQQ